MSRRRADAPRQTALDVLRAVHERDAYANLVLPALQRERRLAARDAAFATELAYGTLRRQGTWDAILSECVDRPLDAVDPDVLDVLRLGVHQQLAMRVPAHAAVSATVDLAREVGGEGTARFVNAVLRRVGAVDLDAWIARITPEDPIGALSVEYSHPRWIVSAFADALGGDLDRVEAALAADNEAPSVTLAARPGRSSAQELVAAGAEPARWSEFAAVLPHGDPASIAAVAEGRAGVQDEGSQLVALALARAPIDGPDRRWLDMCAGPGGKAALLGGLASIQGAALTAIERQPHRAALVARALAGTPGEWTVVTADATVPVWRPASFDRVLLDAPCTGLGALRRRPEARWRRSPSDVGRLRVLQVALLRSALDAVRPEGLVAYVTCSPHLGETKLVVAEVLRRRDDVEWVDARAYMPADAGEGPDVQLWPHLHGTDAMYLALLRRSG